MSVVVNFDAAGPIPEVMDHEHKAVRVENVPSGHYLRRTGVTQQETCSCGMQRHVWLTTFKVDAGAWSRP